MAEKESPSKIPRTDAEECEDPAIVIFFSDHATIHRVLGLPSVVNVRPPVVQGINPAASFQNLSNLLVQRYSGYVLCRMVLGGRNQCNVIIGQLSSMNDWQQECKNDNISAGQCFVITGSQSKCFAVHNILEPYLY